MSKDHKAPSDRQSMAAQLRWILNSGNYSRAYRRAFCKAVLVNYRCGLAMLVIVPK